MKHLILIAVFTLACSGEPQMGASSDSLYAVPAGTTMCDPYQMPPYTIDIERYDAMAEQVRAVRDAANQAGEANEIVARIEFFDVCMTPDGLAMIARIRYNDGHVHVFTDMRVVSEIDTTVTGVP